MYAMNMGVTEALFVRSFVMGRAGVEMAVILKSDSSAGRAAIARSGLGRMKHIDIKEKWTAQLIHEGKIRVHNHR